MITFRGNRLFKGKSFVGCSELNLDNDILVYQGKAFGDLHAFQLNETEILLTEEQTKLLKEHSLLIEQDEKDDLYQIVSSFTERQLLLVGEKDTVGLKNSFQEELNKLYEFGISYKANRFIIEGDKDYLLKVIEKFLKETSLNISETSLPNLCVQLNNFIYNIDKLGGK